VDADLMNEHLARYRFAGRFPSGAVLDIGCGSGYGTVGIGIDVSHEALAGARANFPEARFIQATAETLPFADGVFDLITAFEVIEHLDRWPDLLSEAARVLKPQGILLVSTPNKSYYAEMRATTGPNPFHRHEFDFAEYEAALYAVFPHVRTWAQNHAAAIVFAPLAPHAASLEADGDPHPENAHFFLAACSRSSIEYSDLYAWMPASANVLRERERHIARLEGEIAKKDDWLAKLQADHAALHKAHEQALADVIARSLWAEKASQQVRQRDQTIEDLQAEGAERLAWVRNLEARVAELEGSIAEAYSEIERLGHELVARTAWARSLEAQLETRTQHVLIQKHEIEENKAAITALIDDAANLRKRIGALEAERKLVAESKWIRLGQTLKLGPRLVSES
jgi:SAM-dependent methyltransferase